MRGIAFEKPSAGGLQILIDEGDERIDATVEWRRECIVEMPGEVGIQHGDTPGYRLRCRGPMTATPKGVIADDVMHYTTIRCKRFPKRPKKPPGLTFSICRNCSRVQFGNVSLLFEQAEFGSRWAALKAVDLAEETPFLLCERLAHAKAFIQSLLLFGWAPKRFFREFRNITYIRSQKTGLDRLVFRRPQMSNSKREVAAIPMAALAPRSVNKPFERPDWVPYELLPFESRFLDLNGPRVHYVDEGEGPVLLILAGSPMWRSCTGA